MNNTNSIRLEMPRLSRLFHGDCTELLSTLPEDSVDFVLTDPPSLYQARDTDDRVIPDQIEDQWVRPAFEQIYRVMKQNTLCLSFYDWIHADKFLSAWRSAGLLPMGHLIFVKHFATDSSFTKRRHEQAMLLAKGWPDVRENDRLVDVLGWGRCTGTMLTPDQQPVEPLQRLIRSFTKTGQLVLDPFCGTGSTLIAAQLEGRRAIGVEKDLNVYRVARARLRY